MNKNITWQGHLTKKPTPSSNSLGTNYPINFGLAPKPCNGCSLKLIIKIWGFEAVYLVTGSCDEKTEAQNLEIQCDFRGKCRNLFLTVARILTCVWASEMNQTKCLFLINDIFLGFMYKTRKWQKRQKLSKILWWCVKSREFYRKIQKDRQYAD